MSKDENEVSKRKGAITHDKVILQNVLDELNISGNKFKEVLGYKSPASIYHILQGRTQISIDLMERIIQKYPFVSFVYLNTGKGSVRLRRDDEIIAQKNMFRHLFDKEELNPIQKKVNELEYGVPQQLELMIRGNARTNELLIELIEKIEKMTNVLQK